MVESPKYLLSEDYFNMEQDLPQEEKKKYLQQMQASVDSAVLMCNDLGSITWHPSKQKEGVNISKGNMDSRSKFAVRGTCTIHATFEEIMDTLTTETTSEFRHLENELNHEDFLDGLVLKVLHPLSVETKHRFCCIKWRGVKSMSPSAANHRDLVYIELIDEFMDKKGDRIGYCVSKSFEFDSVPSLEATHQLIRAKSTVLHTFKQLPDTGSGQSNIEMKTMSIVDFKSSKLPAWLTTKISETFASRGAFIRNYIDQQRLSMIHYAKPNEWIPSNQRSACIVCSRNFSLVRKKHNCRGCGEVICNQCSIHQIVPFNNMGKVRTRLCVRCNMKARSKELPTRNNKFKLREMRNQSFRLSQRTTERTSTLSNLSSCSAKELGVSCSTDFISPNPYSLKEQRTPTFNNSMSPRESFTSSNDTSKFHRSQSALQFLPPALSQSDVRLSMLDLEKRIMESQEILKNNAAGGNIKNRFSTPALPSKPILDLGVDSYMPSRSKTSSSTNPDNIAAKFRGRSTVALRASTVEIHAPELLKVERRRKAPEPPTSRNSELDLVVKDLSEMDFTQRPSHRAKAPEAPTSNSSFSSMGSSLDNFDDSKEDSEEVVSSAIESDEDKNDPKVENEIGDVESEVDKVDSGETNDSGSNLQSQNSSDGIAKISPASNSFSTSEAFHSAYAKINKHLENIGKGLSKNQLAVKDMMKEKTDGSVISSSCVLEKDSDLPPSPPGSPPEGFSKFLEDSNYLEDNDNLDDMDLPDGWKSIHSKTTGKYYYYNESCGKTTWTLPEEDESPESSYAVL